MLLTITTMHEPARRLLALSVLWCLVGCATAIPEPAVPVPAGVPLELAQQRAAALRDVAYELDLDVTQRDTAHGSVVIRFTRAAGAGDLVLDFRGLSLGAVVVNEAAVEAAWDRHHLTIPARHLDEGANHIAVRFGARIAAAGAAIIAVDEPADSARYLYTLLVPSDAQLLFPVFDQPDLKARFTWSITAPSEWRVLANGALRERTALPDGSSRWTFHETPPISTYLAAFAAGPWHAFGPDEVVRDLAPAEDVAGSMRLLVRRSRAAEVDADTLMARHRGALAWLEDYFDLRYPFDKMDLLLAPAFPFGGMEHVGAIFYNETNFIFREPPTLTRRLARAGTIYHEVAHQWFGDLVTMRWFDDLWLKEGFATFMAARVQEELQPEANAWQTFYLRNKPLAYGVDVTAGTTPVWQELPNLDLAKSNYGPIVYNKAPSILRQLEFMVGEAAFREGVRLFLRRHAYANATWQDLLAAIGESAGRDLVHFGDQYILRAGAPIIATQLAAGDAAVIDSLVLRQRPAVQLPGDAGGWWPGRVRVRLGYSSRPDTVLDVSFTGAHTSVVAAIGLPLPDYVITNEGDYGYGIFLPDARSAEWLLQGAHSLENDLTRVLAWGALWDGVRELQVSPRRFAESALDGFERERDEQISNVLLGRITTALERYLPGSDDLRAALERVLLDRVDDAALSYDLRKASLDALLAGARSPAAIEVLKAYLGGAREFDGKPLPQPSRWTAVARLLAAGDAQGERFFAAEQQRDSTPEAARSAFVAAAALPDPARKAAYFERYFDDPELNEEWVTASLGGFNHELHAQLSLPYLRPALERAVWLRDHRRIFFLPRWLDAFIGGHSSPEALRIVDEYLAANPQLPPDVRRKILQPRDELARAVRIQEAEGSR
ncbi:MAG TPA: M1 family aminopeptidase [Longimicrobiales bacterium]|nr:M1 family aminopeptidase [Longimicrobiales bacterium]